MELSFRIGDKAVYPGHGVAEIMGVETREISGRKQSFYILKALDSGMKIMIPTSNVGTVGLREVISEDEVEEVYEILRSREISVEGQTWNRRYREYMEKIKTGSIFEIAEVLRDLLRLKFVKELAVAKGIKEEKIEKELETIFMH
jgi:CarD family transcriptional regulator